MERNMTPRWIDGKINIITVLTLVAVMAVAYYRLSMLERAADRNDNDHTIIVRQTTCNEIQMARIETKLSGIEATLIEIKQKLP